MANTRENLIEANKKAVLSPLIGKHGKRKSTIEKERRRQIFDEEVSQIFIDIIPKARSEYLLDQFIGKSPDIIKQTTEVTLEDKRLQEEAEAFGDKLELQDLWYG